MYYVQLYRCCLLLNVQKRSSSKYRASELESAEKISRIPAEAFRTGLDLLLAYRCLWKKHSFWASLCPAKQQQTLPSSP